VTYILSIGRFPLSSLASLVFISGTKIVFPLQVGGDLEVDGIDDPIAVYPKPKLSKPFMN
jgi:hypothetical protein